MVSVPESFWAKEDKATLVILEQALQHFLGACQPAVAGMPLAKLQSFRANTNCIAAETYARWRAKKSNTVAA